jgi:DNA (cytosine-5)-methyltransferase 1
MSAPDHACCPHGGSVSAPTFVDMFAGCGGLSLGLMQAGWKGLFAIEHNSNAFETLSANLLQPKSDVGYDWPEWLPRQPIGIQEFLCKFRAQAEAMRGQVDMVVGGPPCQGYSSAGRRNKDDPRNQLFEAYLEAIEFLQPGIVLVENVRGITLDFNDAQNSGDIVNYSQRLIQRLSTNYHVFSRMLDVSTFGVPQRRIRFFVVAIHKQLSDNPICPFNEIERDRQSFLRLKGLRFPVSASGAISDLEIARNRKTASSESKGFEEIKYSHPMTSFQRLMNVGHKGRLSDTRLARHRPEIAKRFAEIIAICRTNGRLNVSLSRELRASFGLRKCAIRVLDPEAPAPTITSMPDDLIHYSEPRALTVRENARLQGFPDWFVFCGKYTTGGNRRRTEVPRFTQVANAVPPLIAEAMGRTLLRLLTEVRLAPGPTNPQELQTSLDAQAA